MYLELVGQLARGILSSRFQRIPDERSREIRRERLSLKKHLSYRVQAFPTVHSLGTIPLPQVDQKRFTPKQQKMLAKAKYSLRDTK